ncbi:hypothetical protein F5144DRAFT_644289, partial [Chaetomium tenue]
MLRASATPKAFRPLRSATNLDMAAPTTNGKRSIRRYIKNPWFSIAPNPTTTTSNGAPVHSDAPPGHQPNTNLGVYLNLPTHGFGNSLLPHHGTNNPQAGPNLMPLPDQMFYQVPQSHDSAQLSLNWQAQAYTSPMSVLNSGMGQGYQPVQGFYAYSTNMNPLPITNFTPINNNSTTTSRRASNTTRPPLDSGMGQGYQPTQGFYTYPTACLPITNPTPIINNNNNNNNITTTTNTTTIRRPSNTTYPPMLNSIHTRTATTTPITTRGRPSNYGTGERGQRNARLHAQGLCIWCQLPNVDLRRKGCPTCRPRRAQTTARWRVQKARAERAERAER